MLPLTCPSPRTLLHLVLAAALLLQAQLAVAMGGAGMTLAEIATDSHGDASVGLPPCHPAPETDLPMDDCCGAAAGLCQWSCAHAPPLLIPSVGWVTPAKDGSWLPAPAPLHLPWRVNNRFRPPIL